MNSEIKTPADRIVKRFGAERLAGWTSRHRSRVHAWTWSPEKGGTGGVVPPRLRDLIIAGAKRDLGEDVGFAEFEPQFGEAYIMPSPGSSPGSPVGEEARPAAGTLDARRGASRAATT